MSYELMNEDRFGWVRLLVLSVLALWVSTGLVGCGQHDLTDTQYVSRAKDYRDKGNLSASVIELKNALVANPKNPEARWLLGKTYAELGNGPAAEKELVRARELGIDDDAIAIPLVRAKILQHQYDEALKLAHTRSGLSKAENAELLVLRGNVFLQLGKQADAGKAFADALALVPDFDDAVIGQARLAAAKRDFDAARTLLQGILKSKPKSAEAWSVMGDVDGESGDNKQAAAAYTKAIESQSNNAAYYLKRAFAYIAEKDFTAAKADIEVLKKRRIRHPGVYYAQGLLQFRTADYASAQTSFEEALKYAPNYLPVLFYLGADHYAQGHYEQARQYLGSVLTSVPDLVPAQELLAKTNLKLKQPDVALKVLESALARTPVQPQVLVLAAQANMDLKRYSVATEYLERAASIDPKDVGIRTQLGINRLALGDTEQGIADLESAAKSAPQATRADALLVVTYLSRREYDKALQFAEAWGKKQADNPVVYNMEGVAYLGKGDSRGARASFEKALSVKHDYVPAAMNLARLDVREKQPAAARKRLEGILADHRDNLPAMLNLAGLASTDGDDADALSWLNKAVQAHPKSIQARSALVRYYLRKKDSTNALAAAQAAQNANPDSIDALDLVGATQLAAGQQKAALATYTEMTRRRPDSATAHYRLGVIQIATGNDEDGRASLNKALELQPTYLQAQLTLVSLDVQSGRYAQGMDLARRVQKQVPDQPAGYLAEGDMLMAQGRNQQAADRYQQALKLQANGSTVRKLHQALLRAGDKARASKTIHDWLSQHPNDLSTRTYLAAAYQSAGDTARAIAEYEAVLKQNDQNAMALNNLAVLYDGKDDARALSLAEKAYKQRPKSPAIMDTLGWMLARHGQNERGLDLLQKASKLLPKSAEIRYHVAYALAQAGKKAQALRELEALQANAEPFPSQKQANALLNRLR